MNMIDTLSLFLDNILILIYDILFVLFNEFHGYFFFKVDHGESNIWRASPVLPGAGAVAAAFLVAKGWTPEEAVQEARLWWICGGSLRDISVVEKNGNVVHV